MGDEDDCYRLSAMRLVTRTRIWVEFFMRGTLLAGFLGVKRFFE